MAIMKKHYQPIDLIDYQSMEADTVVMPKIEVLLLPNNKYYLIRLWSLRPLMMSSRGTVA